MGTEYEIKFVDAWPDNEIITLYKSGGWWKDHYTPDNLAALIRGSFAFAVAVDGGKAIGMGRALSDGVSDAWIQDVAVLPEFRGKGIGREIIKTLLNYCKEKGLSWIGLVAEPGTKEFYVPLGFKELAGEPMVYEPEA